MMKQKMHVNRDNAQSSVYRSKYTLKILIQQYLYINVVDIPVY